MFALAMLSSLSSVSFGWHYLSNAICLIRPRLCYICFFVSRTTIICYDHSLLKNTCVRQVVLDKWLPHAEGRVGLLGPVERRKQNKHYTKVLKVEDLLLLLVLWVITDYCHYCYYCFCYYYWYRYRYKDTVITIIMIIINYCYYYWYRYRYKDMQLILYMGLRGGFFQGPAERRKRNKYSASAPAGRFSPACPSALA